MPTACEPCPGNMQATGPPTSPNSEVILPTPFDHGCRAGQACSECHKEEVVTWPHAPFVYSLTQRNGYGGRRGITVPVNVHVDLVGVQSKALGNRIDDAGVCLVWDEQGYILVGQSRFFQRLDCRV